MARDELHTESGAEPVESLSEAQARVDARAESLKKARAASAAARKAKAEAKRQAQAKRAQKRAEAIEPPAPAADGGEKDPVQAMLEVPIASHEELAQVLANLQLTACALSDGTAAAPVVVALDWSSPTGKPTGRCLMGARMLWPWLVKSGGLAKLAEQSAEILALCGLVVLTAPALPAAMHLVREARAQKRGERPAAPPAEETPAPTPLREVG